MEQVETGTTGTGGLGSGGWRAAIRGNVLMMGLVSLCTDASSEMIYPLLPVFLTGLAPLGAAAVYVGLMEGVAESTASLLKAVSGRYSDRVGKRKAFAAAGYGLSTVCRSLMAAAGAGWEVVFLRFADRIGKGLRTAPRDALISDVVAEEHRGLAFSFHRAMDHAGAVLGPLAAIVILYGFLGYGVWQGSAGAASAKEMRALRWLFGLALLPGLASMVILWKKVREVPPRRGPASGAPGCPGAAAGGATTGRLSGRFYAFVAIATLFALGNSSDLFLVFYGKTRFQLGLLQIMGLWVMLHASKIVFSLPGGALSDRLGRGPVIAAGWVVYALVYLGLARAETTWAFGGLLLAYGSYYGMTEGAERALVAAFAPSERRGSAYGVYHGAVGLAALPASLLFGVFWAFLGPQLAFSIGAGLAGLAALLLMILLSSRRRTARAV